jgi:hypothetical protein
VPTLLLLLLLLLFLQEYRANNRSWGKQLEICCNDNAMVIIVKNFFLPSFLPRCLKVLKSSPEWKSFLPWDSSSIPQFDQFDRIFLALDSSSQQTHFLICIQILVPRFNSKRIL